MHLNTTRVSELGRWEYKAKNNNN